MSLELEYEASRRKDESHRASNRSQDCNVHRCTILLLVAEEPDSLITRLELFIREFVDMGYLPVGIIMA